MNQNGMYMNIDDNIYDFIDGIIELEKNKNEHILVIQNLNAKIKELENNRKTCILILNDTINILDFQKFFRKNRENNIDIFVCSPLSVGYHMIYITRILSNHQYNINIYLKNINPIFLVSGKNIYCSNNSIFNVFELSVMEHKKYSKYLIEQWKKDMLYILSFNPSVSFDI